MQLARVIGNLLRDPQSHVTAAQTHQPTTRKRKKEKLHKSIHFPKRFSSFHMQKGISFQQDPCLLYCRSSYFHENEHKKEVESNAKEKKKVGDARQFPRGSPSLRSACAVSKANEAASISRKKGNSSRFSDGKFPNY